MNNPITYELNDNKFIVKYDSVPHMELINYDSGAFYSRD